MHKLLEISEKIDSSKELYESVILWDYDGFSNGFQVDQFLKATPTSASSIYSSLSSLKGSTKNTKLLNFLAALLESMNAFTPVADESVRKEIIQGTRESVQFYLNRILKEAKEQNEIEKIEWVKEFQGKLEEILKSSNPGTANNNSIQATTAAATTTQYKLELNGNVWYCEGYKGNSSASDVIDIKIEEMQQRLVISKCSGCVVRVEGKCTAISIEQVSRAGVLLQSPVVSTLELLNTKKLQVQLQAACPTVTIDNCEGIQLFLAKGVEEQFELLTCQCSEINLYKQESKEGDGEFSAEIPVPVQFKSFFDSKGQLQTEPVKHAGA